MSVVAGVYVERLCFRPIPQEAALASMVSSFAIWMQLEELVTVVFPDRTYDFPTLGEMQYLDIGGLEIRADGYAPTVVPWVVWKASNFV